ncbi:MAG: bacteriohemerythrin [Terriglobales bacterium]|jgi:hemerythrin-like metal-binding protein
MGSALEWNAMYSVKVESMDAQHKRLFEIIRELHTAMRSGHGKEVAGEVLGRLIDYTVYHFAAEEKLMEKNGYRLLEAHRVEHRALAEKVVAFKKNSDAGSTGITLDLMTFLQHWLTNHILTVDQKYGEFLNSKSVR